MKTATQIELTIDGQSAEWSELENIWGKASDPINALKEAPGIDVGECQPYIWGMLASSNWTLGIINSQWANSVLEYATIFESGDNFLTCHIETKLADKDGNGIESIAVTVSGECNGEGLPEIVARRVLN